MLRILVLSLVVGCGSAGQGTVPAPSPSPPVVEAPPITAPPSAPPPDVAALNRRVADMSLDRAGRCMAVFELFDRFLPPGVTAPAAAAVLAERAWIVVDNPITVLGGEIPIELTAADSDFVVHCYATPNPQIGNQLWSDWVIYARVSGHSAPTLRSFLAAGADVRLVEYALMYPDGRIEQYRPGGRHSMHM